DGEDVIVSGPGNRLFCAPASIASLTAALGGHPQATISAGSTDVGLWVTKDLHRPNVVIYTGRVRELQAIGESNGEITIGAAVTYTDAMDRLAGYFRDMGEVIRRIGSVQIRNAGTVGGNVANGSPIGDMPPMLIAAGARVHLVGSAGERSMPMENFFIEYGKQDRRSGEIVEKITIPVPDDTVRFRAYKISKRFDQDISAVLGAFSLRLEGGAVTEARLAYGGMAGTPKRALAAEEALKGQPWNESAVQAAMQAMEQDFTPLSDWRASAGYRMEVAKNLLMRAYLETTEPSVETRLVGIPA
ncbi:MAG: FAD binding domain-containing protein, partial [Pseudomonadota bacterium]